MLSWNILGSGFIFRNSSDELVELETQKLISIQQSVLSVEQIKTQSQRQEYILDGYLNGIYEAQIEVYDAVINLLENLQCRGQVLEIELSQIKMQKQIVAATISSTAFKADNLFDVEHYMSMQVVINQQMTSSIVESSAALEQSRLEEKIISNEQQTMDYWQKVSIAPYVKAQNYSNAGFSSSRITTNIGVSATLPIASGNKSKRKEVQARSSLASQATRNVSKSLSLSINEIALELNKNLEKLSSSIEIEQLYIQQIKIAQKAYSQKQLTMQELSEFYIKLLVHKESIIKIIETRELLKTKLLLTTI